MQDENRLRRLEDRFAAGVIPWELDVRGAALCTDCLVNRLQRAERAAEEWPYPESLWAYHLQPRRDMLAERVDRTLLEARAGCEVLNIAKGCPYGKEPGMALIEAGREFEKAWEERYLPEIDAERKRRMDRKVCVVCGSPECVYGHDDGDYFRYCKEHAPFPVECWNLDPYTFYGWATNPPGSGNLVEAYRDGKGGYTFERPAYLKQSALHWDEANPDKENGHVGRP